jgi:hypothetical protein
MMTLRADPVQGAVAFAAAVSPAQAALLAAVLLVPQLIRIAQSAAAISRETPAISNKELETRFEEVLQPAEPPPLDLAPSK